MLTTRRELATLLASSVASFAQDKGRSVRVDGHAVRYWSAGSGRKTLVFIHGWTCDHTFWRLNAPDFEKGWRLLLIDLPGHGSSDKPKIDYTQQLFARAVRAVMRDAGAAKAVLIGHSMGTSVARQFHRDFPEMVSAMVFVDGLVRLDPIGEEAREKFLAPMRGGTYAAFASKFIQSMFSIATMPDIRKEILEKMSATPEHVAVSAMERVLSDPKLTQADPIDVPVLAIYARTSVREADYESRLRAFIPKLEFETLDNVGHFFMMEKPLEFNRRLRQFLGKHGL